MGEFVDLQDKELGSVCDLHMRPYALVDLQDAPSTRPTCQKCSIDVRNEKFIQQRRPQDTRL